MLNLLKRITIPFDELPSLAVDPVRNVRESLPRNAKRKITYSERSFAPVLPRTKRRLTKRGGQIANTTPKAATNSTSKTLNYMDQFNALYFSKELRDKIWEYALPDAATMVIDP